MENLIKLDNLKSLPANPGIYEIVNVNTKDMYVGSSKNLRKRLLAHRGQLKSATHGNALLQHSYNKHGSESFAVNFIVTESENKARELEQEYLNSGRYKYNLSKLATAGCTPTDSVCEYTNEGKFVTTYESVRECSEKLGISAIDVAYCCVGLNGGVGDRLFRFSKPSYEETLDVTEKFEPSDIDWAKFWYADSYVVYRWDLKGELLGRTTDVFKLAKELDVNPRTVRKHLLGRYLTMKGNVYSFTEVFPGIPTKVRNWPILRLDERGNILEKYEYPYVEKLKSQGYPYSVLIDALTLRKGTNRAKKMFWKYDDGTEFKAVKTEGSKSKIKISEIGTDSAFKVFGSLIEAYKFLGISRHTLWEYLKEGKVFRNTYRLEYIND